MKTTSSITPPAEINTDVLIIPVFEGDNPREGTLAQLDAATSGQIAHAVDRGEISHRRDRWTILDPRGAVSAERILFYGAGSRDEIEPLVIQRLSGAAARLAEQKSSTRAAFFLPPGVASAQAAQAVAEGAELGVVTPDFYVSEHDDDLRRLEEFNVVAADLNEAELSEAVKRGSILAEATNFARQLGFAPSNEMTPIELARRAEEIIRLLPD